MVWDTAVLPETLQGQNLDVPDPALFFCLSLCINTPYWHPEDKARRWMVWWSGPSLTAWALLRLRWYFSRQHRYQKRQSEGCTPPDWKNPWGWRSAHRRSRWMHLSGPVGGGGQFAGLYIPNSKHTMMQQQWKINQTECATAPYFSEECVICLTSLKYHFCNLLEHSMCFLQLYASFKQAAFSTLSAFYLIFTLG